MQYKWVQLDLARQMESVNFIKEFIVMMKEAGYNGVLLYLEDRIRTKSYPYPDDDDCYTEEQMRDIVSFATDVNMEIIPCVATLGHAERFLKHPELVHLAELQDGMTGRFGGTGKQVFCPTHPEFYGFISKYLADVAAIFPSKFFHVGLDEFWDYCLCDRCKEKTKGKAGETALFVEHIIKIHEIMEKLGKRIMMWSDMFEYYNDAMDGIPKDVIMVDWQYQEDVRFYLHHLFDCTVEDRFTRNKQLGLDTFIGPVDMLLCNPRGFLEYAADKAPLGCLMTSWEKTDAFLYRTLPVFVYAGKLLSGLDDDAAFAATMRQLFDTDDVILSSAIKLANTIGFDRHFTSVSDAKLFGRDFRGLNYAAFESDASLFNILNERLATIKTEIGKRIVLDMLCALKEKKISNGLKEAYNAVFDGRSGAIEKIPALNKAFADYLDEMEGYWQVYRPNMAHSPFVEKREMLLTRLERNLNVLKKSKFVKLRMCLPDGYGVGHIRVMLRCGGEWKEIGDGVWKPEDLNVALFERFIPYDASLEPDAVRIESYGMGGIGVCWIEVDGKAAKSVSAISGRVENVGHILENNVNFAWFGDQSTALAYFSPSVANQVHYVTLEL